MKSGGGGNERMIQIIIFYDRSSVCVTAPVKENTSGEQSVMKNKHDINKARVTIKRVVVFFKSNIL